MHKWILILIVLVCSLYCKQITYADSPDKNYAPDQLIVRFRTKDNREHINTQEKNQILSSLGGASVKHNFKLVPGLTLVKLPANLAVEEALAIFKNTNEILYGEHEENNKGD